MRPSLRITDSMQRILRPRTSGVRARSARRLQVRIIRRRLWAEVPCSKAGVCVQLSPAAPADLDRAGPVEIQALEMISGNDTLGGKARQLSPLLPRFKRGNTAERSESALFSGSSRPGGFGGTAALDRPAETSHGGTLMRVDEKLPGNLQGRLTRARCLLRETPPLHVFPFLPRFHRDPAGSVKAIILSRSGRHKRPYFRPGYFFLWAGSHRLRILLARLRFLTSQRPLLRGPE